MPSRTSLPVVLVLALGWPAAAAAHGVSPDDDGPLRVVAGAAALVATFVALWAVRRRRGAGR